MSTPPDIDVLEFSGLTFARYGERYGKLIATLHLAFPLVIAAFLLIGVVNPGINSYVPSILTSSTIRSWTKVLPKHASNRIEAWVMGEAEGRLAVLLEEPAIATAALTAAVELAGSILGHTGAPTDLLDELRAARAATANIDNQTGSITLVTRIFSLVNIMWFLAIIGILISIGPVLQSFLSLLLDQLRHISRLVWVYLLAHLWRPAVYIAAMSVFAGADKSSISLDVRVYVCLCAALLVWMLFTTTLVQLVSCKAIVVQKDDPSVMFFYGCVLFVTLAHTLRSSLLGFIAVGAIYSWLGFGVYAEFGGYAVGFSSVSQLNNSIFASVVIFLLLVISRIIGGVSVADWLLPFEIGLQCFGSTSLYLALLLKCNPFYIKGYGESVMMTVALLLGIVFGKLLRMNAITNTALVFTYLYGLNLITFLAAKMGKNFWFAMLSGSVGLFVGALYLHTHPELVLALYRGGYPIKRTLPGK